MAARWDRSPVSLNTFMVKPEPAERGRATVPGLRAGSVRWRLEERPAGGCAHTGLGDSWSGLWLWRMVENGERSATWLRDVAKAAAANQRASCQHAQPIRAEIRASFA